MWNVDEMAEYEISDNLITRQSDDKSQRLIKALRFVVPWLAWQDWRTIEQLNRVICEWCRSKDAATGLLILWREHTMSLFEVGRHLKSERFRSAVEPPLPFLGYSPRNYQFDIEDGMWAVIRSLSQLSVLETHIVENAPCSGSTCVRNDSLQIYGGGGDKWLYINCFDLGETSCILPYFHLKFAVPKGLKIALSDENCYHRHNPSGCKKECYKVVGRAAALGLSGLVVYYSNPIVALHVLEAFVTALQEQQEGEIVLPLEVLSFPSCLENLNNSPRLKRYRHVVTSLRDQIVLGKLRNLKYINFGFLNSKEITEDFGLREVQQACPKLQTLEIGRYWERDHDYVRGDELPNNVLGPHTCTDYTSFDALSERTEKNLKLIGIFGVNESRNHKVSPFGGDNTFSSLNVLLCNEKIKNRRVVRDIAINCPALRFLQTDFSDLGYWCADGYEVLKMLFVLAIAMEWFDYTDKGHPDLPFCGFPEGCELKAMTIYLNCHSDDMLRLDELLDIIDVRLPKLVLVNVVFYNYHDMPEDFWLSCEQRERLGKLEYLFMEKSIDLRFAYQSNMGGYVNLE